MVSRQTFHILLTLAVVFITACGEDSRMREILDQAERHNQDFESMAGDTLLHQATAYYDRWGTSNERLRAHYLLGCHYRDLGEAPAALDEYQTAASLADTTRADCDYHTLCRVHGQMADVFYEQYLPNEMLDALRQSCQYALKAHDTLAWLASYEGQNLAYYMTGKLDSAISILRQSYNLYDQYASHEDALQSLDVLPLYLLENGQHNEAQACLNTLENESSLYCDDYIGNGHEYLLYVKGKCLMDAGKTDSAIILFRQLLNQTKNLNNIETAYKGLYQAYLSKEEFDSVAKYAVLCNKQSDQNFYAATTEKLRQTHALYNYTRHKQAVQMKEAESRQLRSMLTIVILLSLLIILFFLGLFWYLRIRYKHELQIRTKEYEYRIEKIRQARIDLSNDSSKKSQEELVSHENKLKELLHIGTCQNNTVDFCDTDIYHRLQYLVNHPKEKIEKKDYVALIRIFDERIPDFCFKLTNKHRIPEKDLYLCMLIRMNFGVSEICILLNTYSQYVSNRRKQLLTKYFKITGKPEDFDNIVRMVN